MAKHYVTFGQVHTHRINGITLDCDSVALFDVKDAQEGRAKAWEYFGDKFFTDYHDTQWKEERIKFFPRGYIKIN